MTQNDEAWEEARRRAVQGPPPVARVKPLGALVVVTLVLGAWASLTFAIAIAAAIFSHARGWS